MRINFDRHIFLDKKARTATSATRQVRQQWFSGCIFPLNPSFGLTGNRPLSAPAVVASSVSANARERRTCLKII